MTGGPDKALKTGWTTGACATAAVRACLKALTGKGFPDPVDIVLPGGGTASFALAESQLGDGWAKAGVVKDAGDDPDVTHGALIVATVRLAEAGTGLVFKAGPGVGTVTKPGLPLGVGQPAINPAPRQMMAAQAAQAGLADLSIEISVPGGEAIAAKTWNPRLGIMGGISILGTTGIVVPYSCSAWIHSIQSGIDVARACGLTHVAGCVGNTSEEAVKALYGLGDQAIVDMGDFVGGMLKYLRTHPIDRVTVAGGFAKLSKLATGAMDLHSKRSQVDKAWLAARLEDLGADPSVVVQARAANTGLEILELALTHHVPLGDEVAKCCVRVCRDALGDAPVAVDVAVFDRSGGLVGRGG